MYDAFCADLHAHLTSCPNERLMKGVAKDLGMLPDPTLAENDRRVASAEALLGSLGKLRETDPDRVLDLELAKLMLESEIDRRTLVLNGKPQLVQMPRGADAIGEGLFQLLANDPRPAAERLADISARLDGVAAHLDALLARLDTPVARWVAMEIEKIEALPELLTACVDFATEHAWSGRGALEAAANAAKTSLDDYTARLGAMPTTTALHIGDAAARRLVKLRGIEQSLEELHAMARDFLAETRETLGELRDRLAAKYKFSPSISVADLGKFLDEKFAIDISGDGDFVEKVLNRYQKERKRVLEFIEARDLFPILADQDMKMLATPGFLAPSIPAGAMMSPPPFRTGTRRSMIYLTIKRDQLDDHTELGIPGMMIHEGIPGHHLQLATASTHASIIRRHVDAAEHAEGWTTMLEDYMLDVGYMGDLTDEARFAGKRDLARIGARVVIDLFFMTGERSFLDVGVPCATDSPDPFKAAGALLSEVTGFNLGRVEGELNWYSQERGYPLCYLTGNKLVWKLKADAAVGPSGKHGIELDRLFHKTYLEAGNMPLSFLRRVMVTRGLIAGDAN